MASRKSRRLIILAVIGLLLIATQWQAVFSALLGSDTEGTITAPAGEGSPGVDWEGTVPAGFTGGNDSLCTEGPVPPANAWFYILTLDGINATYYDTRTADLTVRIDWDPTGGNVTAQDIALYLRDDMGTLLTSSDGGSNQEFLTLNNPPAGDYQIVACAFAVGLDQPFIGQASLNVELLSGSDPLPDPEVDHGYQFSPITIVDPQRDVAEPSLRVDGNGNIYACGPFGASRAAEYAQKSVDDGDTFRVLGTPPEGRIATGGGGDCELAVGTEPNENGEYTLSYTGLEALVNFSNSSSRDAGASFLGTSSAVTFAGVDRQWMEGTGVDIVYLGYNAIAAGYQVARSADGGLTYANPPVTAVSDLFRPGPIRIDGDSSHNPDQDSEIVYFTFTRADSVWIARSYDQGQTWTEHKVAEGFNPNNIFSSLAIDTAGNLYVTWTEKGSFNAYYAFSLRPTDNSAGAGDVWSEKRLVNRNPINSTAMPWIEAGDPGRISISYYGTEADGNIEVGTFDGYWHVILSTSFNALDPVDGNGNVPFSQAQVTTHPVHWDSICLSGLGCSLSTPEGDRTLLDFFQNRVDTQGRIHFVYNQSNKIPGEALGRLAIVSYSKQISGPSLFNDRSIEVDERKPVRSLSTDPSGDALFPISVFGPTAPTPRHIPAMDILNLNLTTAISPSLELGSFEIELTLEDLSTAALNQALVDQSPESPANSLLYVVRWFSGTEAYAAVASWDAVNMWQFGFNGLSFATVTGSKLETYPGTTPIIGSVDGNTIRMIVEPSMFEALDLPAEPDGAPTIRAAAVGDRIYSVTAFTLGNSNADPSMQEYLNQADSTAPFEYDLTTVPTSVQFAKSGQATQVGQAESSISLDQMWLVAGILLFTLTITASVVVSWKVRRK